ncbi:MAG: reverse transcriptase domain-containing protein [Sweet potato little leaf phytoplasma]|nr:reverse transcriptase domain-containing protein [Sweet potato little leaf phytoplasma]
MVTRGKAGIFKPKVWLTQSPCDWTLTEPVRVADALATAQWKTTMDMEYRALVQNGTWVLVPPHPSYNVVGSKWVFRIKRHPDGSIQRYKARLVAKGFHQTPGIDFFETFSPVVKASTIRVVLTLAVHYGWSLRQLDFNNAFLNGSRDEHV